MNNEDVVVVHYPTVNQPVYRWPRDIVMALLDDAQNNFEQAITRQHHTDAYLWRAKVQAYTDALGSVI